MINWLYRTGRCRIQVGGFGTHRRPTPFNPTLAVTTRFIHRWVSRTRYAWRLVNGACVAEGGGSRWGTGDLRDREREREGERGRAWCGRFSGPAFRPSARAKVHERPGDLSQHVGPTRFPSPPPASLAFLFHLSPLLNQKNCK